MKQITINTRITNRDSGLIDSYFNDINKYDTLSQKDEVEIARRAREDKDEIAIQKLVTSNLRFAITVAKAYQSTGTPLPDLINDASEGLMKAARKFDERKGFKFISYAVWWIKQSIISSLNKNGRAIRLPSNRVGDITKINRFTDKFLKENGRDPVKHEICEEFDFNEDEMELMMQSQSPIVSLNKPFTEGETSTLEETIASEDYGNMENNLMDISRKERVQEIFELLPSREADALKVEYGFGGTYESVAKKHGVSKERIRQLKQIALRRIRSQKGANKLMDLL